MQPSLLRVLRGAGSVSGCAGTAALAAAAGSGIIQQGLSVQALKPPAPDSRSGVQPLSAAWRSECCRCQVFPCRCRANRLQLFGGVRCYSRDQQDAGRNSVKGTQEGVAGTRFSADQPDSHRTDPRVSGDLHNQLSAAADAGAVLKLVEQHGDHFDERALVSTLKALEKACHNSHAPGGGGGHVDPSLVREELLRHQAFQSLLSMVMAGAERLTPQQVSSVARSLGRLRVEDQGVMDSLGRNIVSDMHRLTGPELADLVEGFADSGQTPGRIMADVVRARLGGPAGGPGSQERMTADGTPPASGPPAEQPQGAGEVDRESTERIHRALGRMGYGGGDAGATPLQQQQQQQSDRSHRLDYA